MQPDTISEPKTTKNSGTIIKEQLLSDIFAQTSPIDVFLAVSGRTPKCFVLNDYALDMVASNFDFEIPKATSGNSAKFIFGVNIKFLNKTDTFKGRVEIRRSGGVDDYRIHFILEDTEFTESSVSPDPGGGGQYIPGGYKKSRKLRKLIVSKKTMKK